MKKGGIFGILIILCFFLTASVVFAQRGSNTSQGGSTVSIRLASPLPRNSDWGRSLDRLAGDWTKATNNEVRVNILHDHKGGETLTLSSLRLNEIQAALFLSTGLADVCPAVMTLSIPFFIKNDNELDRVLADVLPVLNNRVNSDFVVVTWAKGGWVNVFSKNPVVTPDELRRQKMGTNAELRNMNQTFTSMGYNMVETDLVDMPIRVNRDMVNAVYLAPAMLPPTGMHKSLNNMLSMPIAPVMAAIVFNNVTWDKIGPNRQREIIRVAKQMAVEFDAITPAITENAMTIMKKEGLTVNRPNQAQEELWYAETQRALPSLLRSGTADSSFDRDLYNQVNGILERMRGGNR